LASESAQLLLRETVIAAGDVFADQPRPQVGQDEFGVPVLRVSPATAASSDQAGHIPLGKGVTRRLPDSHRFAADAITSELGAIRAKLIDVNMKQSQLWPSGLHEKFNALLDSVDGADYAPPRQARDVYSALCAQLDEQIRLRRDISTTRMAELNQMIQAAGLIEVEVDG
jgi:hypothetical protein